MSVSLLEFAFFSLIFHFKYVGKVMYQVMLSVFEPFPQGPLIGGNKIMFLHLFWPHLHLNGCF